MQQIKTLAEAEELIKEYPCIYMVAFITANGEYGSALITMKEDAPPYKAYFTFNEANKDKQLFTIIGLTKLTV